MVALVVAESVVEKFGGDSVSEARRNVEGFLATIAGTVPVNMVAFASGDSSSAVTVAGGPTTAGR
jgi:chorismate synthase